jgi:hypothetical protein
MIVDYESQVLKISAPGMSGTGRLIQSLAASSAVPLIGTAPVTLGTPKKKLLSG